MAIAAILAAGTAAANTETLAKQVAKQRGLPLKKPIETETIDREQLRARLLELAAEDKTQSETRAEGLALARWGMIPPATDYTQLLVDLLTDQIAGYYDPKDKKLRIAKTTDAEWGEMVLAHEILHALQDQSYDLEKWEHVPDGETDAGLARHALVEGDGVALMIELALANKNVPAPWDDPRVARELDKAMSLPSGDALDKAPLAVRETLLFPYRQGFAFVAALRRERPWSAVDAAFKRPPRSTEHILHLDKYQADEKPIAVTLAVPPSLAEYRVAHTTVWGELGCSLFLRSHGFDEPGAAQAAQGWGGDRVLTLARGDDAKPHRAIGLARLEWDDEVDAIEAHEAAVRALDRMILGATAEHTDTRTRWLALDGTASYAERRGSTIVIAHGVPAQLLDAVIADLSK